MTDINLKKNKSFLSKGDDGTGKLIPWFNDPIKLVAAALDSDPYRRKALISGLVDLAASDEAFRRQMQSKFEALGQGKRKRLSMPFEQKMILVKSIEILRISFKQSNKPHSISEVCAIIHHLFNLSPKRVEILYYKLKKEPAIIKALIR